MATLVAFAAALASGVALSASQSPEPKPPKKAQRAPDVHFDGLVRDDMFAGMAGDREALDRAMKLCADALAKDPQHAEAMVWHGVGLGFLSGDAFRAGDTAKGMQLRAQGTAEMDAGVALEPDSITVLIPRGAALLASSKRIPDPARARAALEKGLADYEKVFVIQHGATVKMSVHSRGELLSGLAEGWYRDGDEDKARNYMNLIVQLLPNTAYATRAQAFLASAPQPQRLDWNCIGCHMDAPAKTP